MICAEENKVYNKILEQRMLNEYVKTRDADAARKLYVKFIHLVYGTTIKYLKNSERARQAVTEVFDMLLKMDSKTLRKNIRTIDELKNWLYTASIDYCATQLQTMDTSGQKMIHWDGDQDEEDTECKANKLRANVHPIDKTDYIKPKTLQAIDKLKKPHRDIILDFYDGKKCIHEISVKHNLDKSKVKQMLAIAKCKILNTLRTS